MEVSQPLTELVLLFHALFKPYQALYTPFKQPPGVLSGALAYPHPPDGAPWGGVPKGTAAEASSGFIELDRV